MKVFNIFFLIFLPVVLLGEVQVISTPEKEHINIINKSAANIVVHVDGYSYEMKNGEGLLVKCINDTEKYISIQREFNKDLFIQCRSNVEIIE